jgi:ABC-type phosphate transport system substrate-binding protein
MSSMKRTHVILALGALWFGFGAATQAADVAADVKVIANPSISASEISTEDLKAVFLGTKTTVADSQVAPVLAKAGHAHDVVLKEYLGKSDATLMTYFRGLVFTGKASMPKVCDSDAEIVAYVARTKGAVGYVGAGVSATGTKTLAIK